MEGNSRRLDADRHPFTDAERLRLFQFLDGIYRAERDLGGTVIDVVDTQILRTVAIGKLEGRRHDMSSVAVHLGLPRQTVGRRIKRLIDHGALVSEKCGKRTLLETSPRTRARSLGYMDEAIERMLKMVETMSGSCSK